jgi:tetratricopeptide (TPR) repeat protein
VAAFSKSNRPAAAACLVLAMVTLACYWPAVSHDFIAYDDPQYVLDNSHINSGLTWAGFTWSFTHFHSCNWHPMTWLSHMLDCQLYGLSAPGHLFTNLLLHISNSLLVFLVLKRFTGAFWRSAAVAALFAWHPLHVESVAWVSERKDVLSTLFFLLALCAYAKYAEGKVIGNPLSAISGQSGASSPLSVVGSKGQNIEDPKSLAADHGPRTTLWYLLGLLFFALGLMSKAMLVTLPFVLLLLDFWPLGRIRLDRRKSTPETLGILLPLIREKLPFLALAAVASVVTFWAQQSGGAVVAMALLPWRVRFANALLSYVQYLGKAIWPARLAIVYPYHEVSLGWTVGAVFLLAGLSAFFLWRAKRQPFLPVGWLWFLGTLVPVIGLVQVGAQAMADRYMYIPSIGLLIVLVWGAHALDETFRESISIRFRAMLPGLAAVGALAGLIASTRAQLSYWQNSETLFRHALDVAGGNFVVYDHLGTALLGSGKPNDAIYYLQKATQLEPQNAEAHYNLGTALLRQSRLDEAEAQFAETVRLQPGFAAAESNWGIALRQQGKVAEAASHFLEATRKNPTDPAHVFNLGVALLELDHSDDAANCFAESIRLNPQNPAAHYHLAIALARQHKPNEAIAQAQLARDLAAATGQTEAAAKAAELLKQW